MSKSKNLKTEAILEQWSFLIQGAEGRGEEIFKGIEEKINNLNTPRVEIKREMIAPSRALFVLRSGEKREFLTVQNEYLKGYKIFVGAKDYGKQLIVSWYMLFYDNGQLGKAANMVSKGGILGIAYAPYYWLLIFKQGLSKKYVSPETMDLFDREELTSYTTTVHHAVLNSVGDLMKSLNQDPSKIDRKSKGFLNIS